MAIKNGGSFHSFLYDYQAGYLRLAVERGKTQQRGLQPCWITVAGSWRGTQQSCRHDFSGAICMEVGIVTI
jgi:hypothetical protein